MIVTRMRTNVSHRTNQRTETVLCLLAAGADPLTKDDESHTALHTLATFIRGASSIFSTLVERGIQIDAILSPDIVETFNGDQSGSTALHIAANFWAVETVQLLLLHGANPKSRDAHQRTPLHIASYDRHHGYSGPFEFRQTDALSTVEILLDAAPDLVEDKDGDGATPLLLAAKAIWTMFPALKLLHERGANILAVNNDAQNIIHLAGMSFCNLSPPSPLRESVQYAIQHGVDIEGICSAGMRSLYTVASLGIGSYQGVEALLQNGAQVDAKSLNGRTALHVAYEKGYRDGLGKILLEYGADVTIRDKEGRTPADLLPKPVVLSGRGRGRGRGRG